MVGRHKDTIPIRQSQWDGVGCQYFDVVYPSNAGESGREGKGNVVLVMMLRRRYHRILAVGKLEICRLFIFLP